MKRTYIHQLQERVEILKEELGTIKEGIKDLQEYLSSTKFHVDTTVQVKDVLTRLAETLSSGIRAAVEKENEHTRFWRKEKEENMPD